jgi:serine/threonine-protein kinase RsbW
MDNSGYQIHLSIPSTVEGLNVCLDKVSSIGKEFNFDFDQNFAFHTIIVEAVENAIIHGNKLNRDLYVDIRIAISNLNIFIEVEDRGEGFDLNTIPSPIESANILKESGRGIYFIRKLSNSFVTVGKGNKILIVINR